MLDRTEIEALIPWVHRKTGFGIHNCDFAECQIEPCPRLRVILNRISDARGREKCGHGACVRPKGHTGSHSVHLENTPFSVPQGEGHEAGIEAYRESLASGHFPSRDGIVAVEDVVAALRSYSDDVERVRAIGGEVGRISHRLADFIERKFQKGGLGQ